MPLPRKSRASSRNVRTRGLPAPAILANGINGRAMEEAQQELAEEARQKRVASPGLCPAQLHGLDYPGQPCDLCPRPRHADGIGPEGLIFLANRIPTGSALVGIWPADLFALEAAGWSEDEAQRARSTGAAWFAEVNHPRATCEESTLYALTSSGWKEVK
jgi:hypothetical protein